MCRNIGQFKASLKLNNTTLTVTLIPDVPGAEAYNIWYTNVENPNSFEGQAVAGYLQVQKQSGGNYVIDIQMFSWGLTGLIHLFLSANAGDTGWVAFNVYGGSDPGDPGTEPGPQPGPGGGCRICRKRRLYSCSLVHRITVEKSVKAMSSMAAGRCKQTFHRKLYRACAYK